METAAVRPAVEPEMTDQTTEHQPVPVARIVSDKVRERMVPLEFPVEFDGVTYDAIRIRRVSGKQMAEFFAKVRESDGNVVPPVVDCPPEVWFALDADDQFTIDQAAAEFMPKRLKEMIPPAPAGDQA
jgi:hypothetical protein